MGRCVSPVTTVMDGESVDEGPMGEYIGFIGAPVGTLILWGALRGGGAVCLTSCSPDRISLDDERRWKDGWFRFDHTVCPGSNCGSFPASCALPR